MNKKKLVAVSEEDLLKAACAGNQGLFVLLVRELFRKPATPSRNEHIFAVVDTVARTGMSIAEFTLGKLHLEGIGTPKQVELGRSLMLDAARTDGRLYYDLGSQEWREGRARQAQAFWKLGARAGDSRCRRLLDDEPGETSPECN